MRTRFPPILFGVVLALTLFFAVAAGAQEEKTDTEGVGAQAEEVQKQQVPNDQQRAVVVQKQQLGTAAADAPLSGPLAGARVIVRKDTQPKNSIDKGDVLRIKGNYQVRSGASITIENGDGTQATFVDGRNAEIA